MLQEMNCKLEKENETLTQRLMASTCAVSDLNTDKKPRKRQNELDYIN